MTAFQTGETVIFLAFFAEDGEGKAGLADVVVTIHHETASASTLVVNAAPCTDVGGGFYKYVLTSPPSVAGVLRARFATANLTVDAKEVVTATPYAQVWTDRIDAAISSRMAAGANVIGLNSRTAAGAPLLLYKDDSVVALGTAIEFTINDTPADYSNAAVTLKIADLISVTGTVITGSATSITAQFEITKLQKSGWIPGTYRYQMIVTLGAQQTVQIDGRVTIAETL